MEKTLELALQKAFSRDEETQPSDESGIALPSPGLKMLLKRARSEYDEAQARLKTGNFQGYGESIDQLGKTLEQMSRNQSDD